MRSSTLVSDEAIRLNHRLRSRRADKFSSSSSFLAAFPSIPQISATNLNGSPSRSRRHRHRHHPNPPIPADRAAGQQHMEVVLGALQFVCAALPLALSLAPWMRHRGARGPNCCAPHVQATLGADLDCTLDEAQPDSLLYTSFSGRWQAPR